MLKRLSAIFQAKANKAIDHIEDPREMLDLSYEKQVAMLRDVKRGIVEVTAARKRLELQAHELRESLPKFDAQALHAIQAGREDLARLALERKAQSQAEIDGQPFRQRQPALTGCRINIGETQPGTGINVEIRKLTAVIVACAESDELLERHTSVGLARKYYDSGDRCTATMQHIAREGGCWVLGSGCAHPPAHALCGVVLMRIQNHQPQTLAFAPSGWWLPNFQLDDDRRFLWVYGGDGLGKYRRRVAFLWGRIGVGEPELGGVKVR